MGVGVFVCDCGGTLRERLRMEELAKFARGLEGVDGVEMHAQLCGKAGWDSLSAGIREMGVDRAVVVGCSPGILEETIRGA